MRKILKHFILILLIAHCALIFGFSAQNKKQSSVGSEGITQRIVKRLDSESTSKGMHLKRMRVVEKVVRKSAHVFLYAILGVLAYLNARKYSRNRHLILAMLFCLLYAVSDELHQAFVPGRAGLISDVLIDFAGSMLGMGIVCLIIKLKRRKKA